MNTTILRSVIAAFAVATTLAGWALAGDWCSCKFCGRNADCNKRCRLVCEEKKVEVVCWGCKCEDFCAPGCGKPGCEHCDEVCQSCADPDSKVCCEPKTFLWKEWTPFGKPKIYTKTKLMKKIEPRKVPTYKWVVEDVCEQCEPPKTAGEKSPASAPLPPEPKADQATPDNVYTGPRKSAR